MPTFLVFSVIVLVLALAGAVVLVVLLLAKVLLGYQKQLSYAAELAARLRARTDDDSTYHNQAIADAEAAGRSVLAEPVQVGPMSTANVAPGPDLGSVIPTSSLD